MDEPSKKRLGPLLWLAGRSVRFWLVVALLPVLYAGSFGPACWLVDRQALPLGVAEVTDRQLSIFSVNVGCGKGLCWYGTLVEPAPVPAKPIYCSGFGPLPAAVEILLLAAQLPATGIAAADRVGPSDGPDPMAQ